MPTDTRYAVEWTRTGEPALRAYEPTETEIAAVADGLAAFYNEPFNRSMMTNETEMSAADVVDYWREARRAGGRGFLLERGGVLMGDADFRHVEGDTAEFAIMIGERAAQGHGLGQRFGTMLHALGFGALGLERAYAVIIPANRGSQRLFQKLGYEPDAGEKARSFVDADDDLTFSLTRERFFAIYGSELRAVRVEPRRT